MPRMTPHSGAAEPSHRPRTDIGRRMAARREELGLSREEVAERSGAATSYIEYLEERPATPDAATLQQIAAALETSVAELTGGTVDRPPGLGVAARDAELLELDEAECLDLMSTYGVGRIGALTPEGPAVVSIAYDDED